MEQKINIAELLKDCPKGMELDCAMYDNCTYEGIEDNGYIDILINTPSGRIRLTKEGCYIRHDDNAKCIIFPKNKTTWEGFIPPCKFKDGDIVATSSGGWIGITTGGKSGEFMPTYCVITGAGEFEAYLNKKETWQFHRLATTWEKQKLFDAIKANGYKWNPETKTLEKLLVPKFKVGDKIRNRLTNKEHIITHMDNLSYYVDKSHFSIRRSEQDIYELVPNKFDITTLKPFDKVLVRDNNTQKWTADLFSFYDKSLPCPYSCVGHYTNQCVPYEKNEHLLATTNDCDEYFKTWEK